MAAGMLALLTVCLYYFSYMGDFHLMLQMDVTPYISGLKKNLVILFRAFNFLFKTTKLAKKNFCLFMFFPKFYQLNYGNVMSPGCNFH